MALTPAQKQQRYRDKLKIQAQAQASPETIEAALMAEVERAQRGELSAEQRTALANKLSDLAMRYLWQAKELAEMAQKVRTL
jgi:hypothetical protein